MTLRFRTTLSMLLVVTIPGIVATVVGWYLLQWNLDQEAQNRVRQDLNAALEFYQQRLESMEAALRYTALGQRFSRSVAAKDLEYISSRLQVVFKQAGFDTLCVTDPRGHVIFRVENPGVSGDSLANDALVRRVVKGQGVVSGTKLVPLDLLRQWKPSLAEVARITIIPTPKAKTMNQNTLSAGMMLASAAPVSTYDGRFAGVLRAGILLNRNFGLVDQVQNTVFRGERYEGKNLGVATVFQNGVRISTNLLRKNESRAIGSQVSAGVYDHVLRRGQTWVGRAWGVNDWYITAYTPLRDPDGKAIGMLGIGVLEKKYRDLAARTLTIFLLVILAGFILALFIAWRLANSITHPVRSLASASAAVADGDFLQKLPVKSDDEIGALTRTFNRMAQSLRERDELLKERTRQQLTHSERLASIGRLASGVAHEINNPLTGVLTFAHILGDSAPGGSQEKKDIETIIKATERCKDIVKGLLNFSRQNEPNKSLSDLNQVLQKALDLTRNQASIHRVEVLEKMDPGLPHLVIDANQIQEVAVNLIVNAIDAMPKGGELTVRTRAVNRGAHPWAEFEVSDTGCGIEEKGLEQIFDPFFTTKPAGSGTGLGLAIAYGIVTEHGGQIQVASEVGKGTNVVVKLPITSKESNDASNG